MAHTVPVDIDVLTLLADRLEAAWATRPAHQRNDNPAWVRDRAAIAAARAAASGDQPPHP